MTLKRAGILFVAAAITGLAAANAHADVSAAGVLFLKLPPGARAAAMGESFTAVADDATATHWNPAGLGSPAFSSNWESHNVPDELRPFKDFAVVKSHGGSGFGAYDVWAITGKGLARYDGKNWGFSEKLSTRTDQTMGKIVSSLFNTNNAEDIDGRSRKIAEANSKLSYAATDSMLTKLVGAIPDDSKQKATITAFADSIRQAYDQCLVNWDKVTEANKQFESGMSDGKLSETEIDRILFSLERGRNRFLPEELTIPFSAGYDGEATALESHADVLYVGTTEGFYQFMNRRWLKARSDSSFTAPVRSIMPVGGVVLVGFTNGLAKYNAGVLTNVEGSSALPKGEVKAISGTGIADTWVAIDSDLYHWNGSYWANWQQYTAVLDDTPERIAAKFALYGTPDEAKLFADKLNQINAAAPEAAKPDSAKDSTAVDSSTTATPTTPTLNITAGKVIKVPYVAMLKGNVTSLYSRGNNQVWVGTDYGVLHFTGTAWEMPGYAPYTVQAGETATALADKLTVKNNETKETYAKRVGEINGSTDGTFAAGDTIKVYRTAAAAPVRAINSHEGKLYVATSEGLLVVQDGAWGRADIQGFGNADARAVSVADNELWLGSSEKATTRKNAHKELALMHVQLLPGLGVEDVYYEFLSFVTPIEGWGAMGLDVSFLSLGKSQQTDDKGALLSDFYSFETAVAVAYGTSITPNLKGGLALKVIYSHLSPFGAGAEKGDGTSTGFAGDAGILYYLSKRATVGLALRNLGPNIAYVDAAQSDPLPRTVSLGLAYKLRNTENMRILLSTQIDKEMVAINDGFSKELSQTSPSFGVEIMYANLFAIRGGYKYDGDDPDNSVATLGAGLVLLNSLKFDFAYTPGFTSEAQKNTLRSSLGIMF